MADIGSEEAGSGAWRKSRWKEFSFMMAVKTGGVVMVVRDFSRCWPVWSRIVKMFWVWFRGGMIKIWWKIVIRTVIVVDLWKLAITYLWHIKLLRGNLSYLISQILTMDLDLKIAAATEIMIWRPLKISLRRSLKSCKIWCRSYATYTEVCGSADHLSCDVYGGWWVCVK